MKAQTSGIIKVLAWCWAPKSGVSSVVDGWLSTSRSSQPWATHLSIIHISAVSITSEHCFSWSMMITHPTCSCISCTSALPSPCRSRGGHGDIASNKRIGFHPFNHGKLAPQEQNVSAEKSSWWGRSGRRGPGFVLWNFRNSENLNQFHPIQPS